MNALASAPVLPITRSSRDWVTPAQLRTLLKQSLGYNQRQVTVNTESSDQYVRIVVRDAKVDLKKVEAFASQFHTWSSSQDDCYDGQSVRVKVTDEVKNTLAAPFIEEVKALIAYFVEAEAIGHGATRHLSNGTTLVEDSRGFYIERGDDRTPYVDNFDARRGSERAIAALAYNAARI